MTTTHPVRRLALAAGVALAATTAMSAPALAASPNGQTVSMTDNVHGTFYESQATNPCTGDTFNGGQGIQFTGNLVDHETYFTQSDEVWATFTETGSIMGVDDGTGATYSGRATAWGNFNLNEKNANGVFTLTIHASGSDGSAITAHEVTTFVMNANGTVTVNFDKASLSCG
jgi:hypothetical protein